MSKRSKFHNEFKAYNKRIEDILQNTNVEDNPTTYSILRRICWSICQDRLEMTDLDKEHFIVHLLEKFDELGYVDGVMGLPHDLGKEFIHWFHTKGFEVVTYTDYRGVLCRYDTMMDHNSAITFDALLCNVVAYLKYSYYRYPEPDGASWSAGIKQPAFVLDIQAALSARQTDNVDTAFNDIHISTNNEADVLRIRLSP